jgi:catechol 2,3-dioxygenase-like lactoylglutathione lyase family enzyme
MAIVNVRYMVDDVDQAVDFYTNKLGFELLSNRAPAFADVVRGDLRLLLSGASSRAAGTALSWSSTTSRARSIVCAPPG